MSNQVNSMNKGLTVKDLVTTGIFTALLFVFVLVGGVFFATNPVLTFSSQQEVGCPPHCILLIAKVHCMWWSLSIIGVIMGIIWFRDWYALGFCIGLPDPDRDCRGLCCWCRAYKQKTQQPVLYTVFSAALVRISCSLLTQTAGSADMLETELNRATSTPCRQTTNTGILIAMFAAYYHYICDQRFCRLQNAEKAV